MLKMNNTKIGLVEQRRLVFDIFVLFIVYELIEQFISIKRCNLLSHLFALGQETVSINKKIRMYRGKFLYISQSTNVVVS
jgi:hypothetical protein